MINTELMPLGQLRRKGFEALVKELGVANALRFLSLYEAGRGDYTKDRDAWLGSSTVEEVAEDIREMKRKGELG
jgi:hypothetical protein